MTREEAITELNTFKIGAKSELGKNALDMAIKALEQEPKTGHWSRKTKVDGVYDIAGVKTWGIKCQCDRCDFTTTVIEDFGYYKYCPNCGTKIVEQQESEDRMSKETTCENCINANACIMYEPKMKRCKDYKESEG